MKKGFSITNSRYQLFRKEKRQGQILNNLELNKIIDAWYDLSKDLDRIIATQQKEDQFKKIAEGILSRISDISFGEDFNVSFWDSFPKHYMPDGLKDFKLLDCFVVQSFFIRKPFFHTIAEFSMHPIKTELKAILKTVKTDKKQRFESGILHN